jgi:hypothetical protein
MSKIQPIQFIRILRSFLFTKNCARYLKREQQQNITHLFLVNAPFMVCLQSTTILMTVPRSFDFSPPSLANEVERRARKYVKAL